MNEGDEKTEPAPEAAEQAPPAAESRGGVAGLVTRLQQMRWLRLALAPALAAGAAGVHFSLNVPRNIQHSPRDQGVKPMKPPTKKPRESIGHTPRSEDELKALWAKHAGKSFAGEPKVPTWARKFQSHVNKAVVVARGRAFEGAPEPPQVLLAASECKTVRCRFLMRGPFAHEVNLLVDTLRGLEHEGKPLWRDFESINVPPPDDGSPKEHFYLQVTVAFASDEIDPGKIEVPGDEDTAAPGKAAPPEPAGAPRR